MGPDVQNIVRQIEEFIRVAGGSASGSTLATHLKQAHPDWAPSRHGASSLREFIRTNVPGVRELDRVGMDVRYGVVEHSPAPLPVNRNVWRAWVSPNSQQILAVDKRNLDIRALRPSEAINLNDIVLKPPDVGFHRNLAKRFLESVPSDAREALTPIVESPEVTWWKRWSEALKRRGESQDWWSFRRAELEAELSKCLTGAGFSKEESAKLTQHVLPEVAEEKSFPTNDPSEIRRVAVEVVRGMTELELRELRLPLGAVLDAVAALKRR